MCYKPVFRYRCFFLWYPLSPKLNVVKLKWIHNNFFFHLFDSSFSKFYRFLLQRIQYNFSFDENSFCGISDCSFCSKFWDLHIFIYSATWPYLLCTQHAALILVSLHPGPLLFLLCLTRCQSVSKTSDVSFHTQST